MVAAISVGAAVGTQVLVGLKDVIVGLRSIMFGLRGALVDIWQEV